MLSASLRQMSAKETRMADIMREHSAGGSQKYTAAQLSQSAPMPTVHALKDLGSSEDDPNRLSAAGRRPTRAARPRG